MTRPTAVVVGLGAVGSAAALHLARAGWEVIGLDRWRPPHRHGSTHGETRVTRTSAWEGAQYVPLVGRANVLIESLAQEVGEPLGMRTGGLFIGAPHDLHVAGSLSSAVATGIAHEMLDAEAITRRWPELVIPDGMVGFFDPDAGVLYPERIVEAQLRLAEAAGAELLFDSEMLAFGVDGDSAWVRTEVGAVKVDRVILCTGAWMSDALVGVPLKVERVTQHWFAERDGAPRRGLADAPVILTSDGHGTLTAAFQTIDGRIKGAGHGSGKFTSADAVDRVITADDVEPVQAALQHLLPQHVGAHLESTTCLYTCTPNGDFILDRDPEHPQLIYGSACNGFGFKFSPASGEILACLAMGTAPPVDPTPWRLVVDS